MSKNGDAVSKAKDPTSPKPASNARGNKEVNAKENGMQRTAGWNGSPPEDGVLSFTRGLESDTYIVFELDRTHYAVPSHVVQQMEMIEQITLVPNAPKAVEGVVFTRGQVIPAVNLRVRFGLPKVAHTLRSRLVVISSRDRTVGLIVDTAREFLSIPAKAIKPPPDAISEKGESYLLGIATLDERMIMILNSDRIVESTDLIQIALPDEMDGWRDGD